MTGPRAQIDLSALADNYRMLARRAAPAQAAAVVKADGYGLGAARIARTLAEAGARRFYVAWPEEGAELRTALGADVQIAVFHGPQPMTLPVFAQAKLEPVINSMSQLELWLGAGRPAPYALHVDTGMNRLGLSEPEWAAAAARTASVQPTHLVSHLACPDEPDHALNEQQLARYMRACELWPGPKKSFSSTAGVYLGPRYCFDEVRPGIGLYGGGPVPADGEGPKPVLRLTAPILMIREVPAGETVGYGASRIIQAPSRIAALGLGYADGFLRSASNRGYAVIRGERRPILGRVSMDLIMLDVTGLDAEVGEEVEFVGPAMPLAEQAEAMGTIDYEILTRLGRRASRIYSGGA